MTNSLSQKANNILSIIFSILLFLLTIIVGWQLTMITAQNVKIEAQNEKLSVLPEKYVRLERYCKDIAELRTTLRDINVKLDRVIDKQVKYLDK